MNTRAGRQHRLLVVDDDLSLLEELRECLEDEGYVVLPATSGNAALKRFEEEGCDLVLSDIRMADGDGIALLRAVRERDAGVPFLLMTGYSDIREEDALALGASGYFNKPMQLSALFSTIEAQLARS